MTRRIKSSVRDRGYTPNTIVTGQLRKPLKRRDSYSIRRVFYHKPMTRTNSPQMALNGLYLRRLCLGSISLSSLSSPGVSRGKQGRLRLVRLRKRSNPQSLHRLLCVQLVIFYHPHRQMQALLWHKPPRLKPITLSRSLSHIWELLQHKLPHFQSHI